MDALSWAAWTAAGAAAGFLAGLVPGLHANTLLPLLPLLPGGVEALAAGVPAFATAHGIAALVPATYVGVPDPDGAVIPLPAHRLLHDGRGPFAIRVAVHATLLATLLGVLLLWPAKWLLDEPGRASDALAAVTPWALAALCGWILWAGRRRFGPNTLVFALAAALGLLASRFHPAGILGPLLPLGPVLAGLFGGAGLVEAVRGTNPVPEQRDDPPSRRTRRATATAALAGSLAALVLLPVSAATPAVAASFIPARTPERSLASLAAVGAAHQTLALGALWATGRPRTGLAGALVPAAQAQPWAWGSPPPLLLALLLAVLASALLACPAAVWVGRSVPRFLARWPPRVLPTTALAFLSVLQLGLGGWQALVLFAAALFVGLVPLATGARRLQLVACLVVPALARSLGLTP